MARQTRIKKGSIDLSSVFSPGYMLDSDGKLINGYVWKKFTPQLNPHSQSITDYQLPEVAHVVDSTILLYMFVNGVKVEPEYLSLNQQENTIVEYNDIDYQIVPSDLVDIWYVPTASVGGQAEESDQELPQAAGAGGHLQINDGQDQITFAPVKWINNALVPDQDMVYDLGTSTKRWNDLYLNANSIILGAATISFDPNQNKLAINGDFLAKSDEVDPQNLIQDQTFVNALKGATGPQGPVGAQGAQGLQGIQGVQGPAGNDGNQGTQGPQGDQGLQGLTGPQGIQGVQGPAGISITFKGAVSQDPSGSGLVTLLTAATFTPSSGDAVLSQTDDSLFVFDGTDWVDGGSIQGPQGVQGIQGVQGPQGSAGSNGSAGIQGIQGVQGPQGIQGSAGLSVSNLSIAGTTVAATLSDGTTTISGTLDMSLTNLSDVDLYHTSSTITDGYVLTYDTTHNHWHPEPMSQSTNNNVALNDISDVNVPSPDAGSNLVYNNTSWVEDKVVNIPHSTSSGGQFPIVDIRNVSIEYYSRVDITTAAGTRLEVIVPDPSQATLGRILEVNLNTAGGNQLTNIYTWRSNFNNTNDFVNDGNLSSVYYRSAGYTNLKFKVVQVGANYRWENIHRAPISQPEYSEIGLLDTSVSTTDTGTDGNINFKTNNVSRWDINSSGHIIPAANAAYDLGEASSKVRHLYLSDNSIKFESGDLGVNGNGNLSFTPTGQASTSLLAQQNNLLTIQGDSTSGAIKLNCEDNSHGVTVQGPPHSANATYTLTLPETIGAADQVMKVDGSGNLGWVTPSSGGSGASPEAMIAINTSTLNMAPTAWSPNYAFSNMRGASYSARNTWFSSNNTILTKTIQNTTLPKAHYTYPTTSFPAGKYRFIWRLTLTKPSSGTYSVNENIVDGLLNYSHGPSGQISANHNLIYKKLRHFYEITASNIEIEVEFIFEMASASMLKLWKDYAGSSENWRHWLAQEFTLLEEYQEMQKLSNYSFDSSLTL